MLIEAIRRVAQMSQSIKASRLKEFSDMVYGFFRAKNARAEPNHQASGFTKKHYFDVRLNGSSEALVRTIAANTPHRVEVGVERAWFSFSDVARTGREFRPVVVFDDTEEDYAEAWREGHFRILQRYEILTLGFDQNRDQLIGLAEAHGDH
jgi:hypothetical protein